MNWRIPDTEDLLVELRKSERNALLTLLRPSDEGYVDQRADAHTIAPKELFPLLRELYRERGLEPPRSLG